MRSIKTQAIVLKRINLKEADRIVTVFSLTRGKINFIAKGVRKIKSHNASAIELFSLSEFMLYSKGKLDILTGSHLIRPFPSNIDLEKIKLAGFLAGLYIKNLPEEYANEKLFNLLAESYREIDSYKTEMIKYYFIAKYLKINGVYFELENCLKCGKKITEDEEKTFSANGLICRKCTSGDYPSVSNKTIKILRAYAETTSLESLSKIKVEKEERVKAEKILERSIKRQIT